MNLKDLFSKLGTNLYDGMPPEKFIQAVVSVPVFVTMFPKLGDISTTVAGLINTYEELTTQVEDTKAKITDLEDQIDTAQSTINKANDAYTKALNLPGAYVAPTTGGPCEPNPTYTEIQAAISTAVSALEDLKSELKGTKNTLTLLEQELDKFYKSLTSQISKYIDVIINTRVA